jgi:chemotaxis signal transduction protein
MSAPRTDHYILFVVAGTTYALPTADIAHVEIVEQITRVPNAAPFVDGVVFSRGEVVPAVNLRARFGFDRIEADLRSRLLVIHSRGRAVGLVVDACREFLTIPADAIAPPGDGLGGSTVHYLTGIATVGGRLIAVVDVDELLNAIDPVPMAPAGALREG